MRGRQLSPPTARRPPRVPPLLPPPPAIAGAAPGAAPPRRRRGACGHAHLQPAGRRGEGQGAASQRSAPSGARQGRAAAGPCGLCAARRSRPCRQVAFRRCQLAKHQGVLVCGVRRSVARRASGSGGRGMKACDISGSEAVAARRIGEEEDGGTESLRAAALPAW